MLSALAIHNVINYLSHNLPSHWSHQHQDKSPRLYNWWKDHLINQNQPNQWRNIREIMRWKEIFKRDVIEMREIMNKSDKIEKISLFLPFFTSRVVSCCWHIIHSCHCIIISIVTPISICILSQIDQIMMRWSYFISSTISPKYICLTIYHLISCDLIFKTLAHIMLISLRPVPTSSPFGSNLPPCQREIMVVKWERERVDCELMRWW